MSEIPIKIYQHHGSTINGESSNSLDKNSSDRFEEIQLDELSNATDIPNLPRDQSKYFSDSIRIIDFILVYALNPPKDDADKLLALYRLRYETALREEGLELEHEPPEKSIDGKAGFIKIHAPFRILQRQAEMKKMSKAFKESETEEEGASLIKKFWNYLCKRNVFSLQKEYEIPKKEFFSEPFQRAYVHEFLGAEDENNFFTSTERIYLTWDIMSSVKVKLEEEKLASIFLIQKRKPSVWSKLLIASKLEHQEITQSISLDRIKEMKPIEDGGDFSYETEDFNEGDPEMERCKLASIQLLINIGVYKDAFPLHDGDINSGQDSTRQYLYESWARPRQWRRYQPLSVIREYYGEKMALYFALIGFYTKMLVPPSIMGVLISLHSFYFLTSDGMIEIICHKKIFNELTICPECPTSACSYTKVKNYCHSAMLEVFFDNNTIIITALFMTVWSICFLEFWKRYRSQLCADWSISDKNDSDDNVRPEYTHRVPHVKLNPVTMKMEPHLKWSSKLKRISASIATVIFFITIVISILAGIIVYKEIGQKWWQKLLADSDFYGHNEYNLIVSVSASVGNGIFIAIMTQLYIRIAWFLTCAEFPRTDRDFEHSYAYKVFIFQCVNYYGALFYLAFYRGQRAPPPHEQTYFDTRCPLVGCVFDVTIQLAIIFTGKQIINQFVEIGVPFLKTNVASLRKRWSGRKSETSKSPTRWESDFNLVQNHKILLFSDYLQLLIQYGFVTMFSAVFPLAPAFALINNIVQIRLGAYKNIALTRRCIPARSGDIGPWYNFLKFFTKLSILTNAMLIAFTSNFVRRQMHIHVDHALERNQSINATLTYLGGSLYRTSDFYRLTTGNNDSIYRQEEYCFYVGSRYPPDDPEEPYGKTIHWWYRMGFALVFVVAFENFIWLFQVVLAFFIPDVPKRVQLRLRREKCLSRMNFLRREFGVEHNRSQSEDSDGEFVPDELPSWANSTNLAEDSNSIKGQSKSQRGKIIRPRKPFLVVIFRKLMLCD